jgi:hypothetical protein
MHLEFEGLGQTKGKSTEIAQEALSAGFGQDCTRGVSLKHRQSRDSWMKVRTTIQQEEAKETPRVEHCETA